MVQPKTRKGKANNWKGKARSTGDHGKMNEQLATLGLKVVNISGDGNCFFRAIADQLEGREDEHAKYRRMVVDYLEEHRYDFEPFLEDETPFDEYCINMRQDGTWAGHMELQAMSLATKCNICIHRVGFPRWQIMNFQNQGIPILQLSYHGEEHYNSVRPVDDEGVGPPKLEFVRASVKVANEPPPAKDGKKQMKATKVEQTLSASIKLAMAGSGCTNEAHVKQVLDEVRGDTSAAIEYLIAEKNLTEEISQSAGDVPVIFSDWQLEGMVADDSLPAYEPDIETINLLIQEVEGTSIDDWTPISSTPKKSEAGPSSRPVVSRNKACPCGSKKKYKVCCGALNRKPSITIVSSGREGNLSNKARKEQSRAAKAAARDSRPASSAAPAQEEEMDLGVLCI